MMPSLLLFDPGCIGGGGGLGGNDNVGHGVVKVALVAAMMVVDMVAEGMAIMNLVMMEAIWS